MPTDAEMEDLITKRTFTWMTRNGVYGKLVTGKGAYADRSIFFPATGYGDDSNFYLPGSKGNFWSSSTYSNLISSWGLAVSSDFYGRSTNRRYSGQSVRPVRDAVQ